MFRIGDDKIAKQNYSVARIVTHTRDDIGKFERHIERKNDNYANMNVDLSQSHRNIQFKKCDCTYNDKLNEMVESKQISLRGLKTDAKVYDEMIFDVNTEYFESHGGYEFAKDNGFDNPKFFFDDGYSGVSFNRPAFSEIMELAEQGKVRTLIVKDHSRLGRNRLVVGQLLEEDFDRLGVRYIAIMDNIDTANGLSDLVPMQDLFNEWHAKNTSQKVRNYFRNKGMSGVPITTKLPYGYLKDPNDKNKWLVDEYAASIVRKIFDLCLKGLGPSQIANKLKEEKILRPYHYWKQKKGKQILSTESPYSWDARIVADILERQEYVGDTVNFKCTTKSFKNKEKIHRPKEEWVIFENTHPAIIDRETFAIVQKLRENRCRRPKSGIKSIFAGLLFCAD